MNITKVLEELRLSEGEIKVYLALLKIGSAPVNKIKEETNLHRTTIYDFIDKLINKGLANYVIMNNIKFFKATHPNKLLDIIKEKENNLKEILPELIKLKEFEKEQIKVEVYKGREGFKTLLNDMIRIGKEMVAFGIDETKFKKRFPILIEKHFKNEEKIGIKERLLTSEKTKFFYKKKTATYKFIPEEYFNPTPTVIYGNKVVNIIWEPFTVIMIENFELADSYRKHFEMLWKIAKKTSEKKV